MKISQRDIVSISLNPTKGREQRGTRPAVIISGNAFHISGLCLACPLTTKIRKFEGNVILTPNKTNNLKSQSEILIGQTRSLTQERIGRKIGSISTSQLESVFEGIDLILNR